MKETVLEGGTCALHLNERVEGMRMRTLGVLDHEKKCLRKSLVVKLVCRPMMREF